MQRTLIFEREERLALVERATFPGVTCLLTLRLKGLLRQLEVTTGRKGCFPSQTLLGEKMGVERRTVMRWVKRLRSLGLIVTDPRVLPARGNSTLNYQVDWQALRGFCTPKQLHEIFTKLACKEGDSGPAAPPENVTAAKKMRQRGVTRCDSAVSHDVTASSSLKINRPSSAGARESDAAQTEAEAFLQLVKLVDGCGVDQAQPAVQAARAAGCTPAQIIAAIEHYRRLSSQGVTPGALYVKLSRMQPGESADRRFPKSKAQPAANRQQWLAAAAIGIDVAEQERQQRAAEAQQFEELEQLHGRALDSLAGDQRAALHAAVFARLPGLEREYQRKPSSRIVRAELLRELSQQEAMSQ